MLGQGLDLINVTFDGDERSAGYFRNGAVSIGLDQGVILSTGRAKSQPGLVGADAIGMMLASSPTTSLATDVDLQTLAGGQALFDLQVFEIRVVPRGDSMQLSYVFASEEYPENACTDAVDRFGVFVSGPGIAGPFTGGAVNMALVPGSPLPVNANTINSGTVGADGGDPAFCTLPDGSLANSALYNDNDSLPFFPAYDGYTDPITNKIAVVPCQEYVIRIVIADVGDDQDDSALFFKAEGLASNAFDLQVSVPTIDARIAEGCSPANITLALPDSATADRQVAFSLFGNAQLGVDYTTNLPMDTLFTFPQGDTTFTVSFEALSDGIAEGEDSIFFELQTDVCKRDTFLIRIVDDTLPSPVLRTDMTICPGDTVALNGGIGIPAPTVPSFVFQDSIPIDTNDMVFTFPLDITGVNPATVGPGVINSVCIDSISHGFIADLDIFLLAPNGQILELTTDNGGSGGNGSETDFYLQTCFSEGATQAINFPGPEAPPGAVPFTGTFLPEGDWSSLYGSPTNGTWQMVVVDDRQGDYGVFKGWSISFSGPYSVGYSWSPAAGLDCPACPDPIATPTTSTDYVLTVTDSYGCSTSDSVTISTLAILPAPENLQCDMSTETTITVTWDLLPGAADFEVNIDGTGWVPANGALTHTFTGLRANTPYIIQVRGVDNCPGEARQIGCFTLPCTNLMVDIDIDSTRCPGVPEGTLNLTASGGQGTYTYVVDGIGNTTGVFPNLTNQIYDFTVTDSIGCEGSGSVYIPVIDTILLTLDEVSGVLCRGDTNAVVAVTAVGPDPNYTFAWNNGQTGAQADSFPAGYATVQATGVTGCTIRDSVLISEPAALQPGLSAQPISCFGASDGIVSATTFGGTLPYNYLWTDSLGNVLADTVGLPEGEYRLTVTDANGCVAEVSTQVPSNPPLDVLAGVDSISCFGGSDGRIQLTVTGGSGNYFFAWSTGSTETTLNNLDAGTYSVEVSDDNGCFVNDTFQLTNRPLLEVSLSGTDLSCKGGMDGTLLASASGGTGPYTYNWNPGFIGDTSAATQLAAGVYSLQILDSLGCVATDTLSLIEPEGILFDIVELQEISCQGDTNGAIDLEVSGGTFPYQFSWSNGADTEDVSGLAAGNYTVVVTDGGGCSDSLSVFISDREALSVDFRVQDAVCPGEPNGAVTASVRGGLKPYEILWQDGTPDSTLTDLAAGFYFVLVSDRNGCTLTERVEVTEPDTLVANVAVTDPSCTDFSDGEVNIQLSGATPPFTYSLDDRQQNSGFFPSLASGSYIVDVMDANGCEFLLPLIELEDPDPLEVPVQEELEKGFDETVNLNPIVNGGIAPYTFFWNPVQDSLLSCLVCEQPATSVSQPTDFFFRVEDANGCRGEGVYRVVVLDDFQALVPTGFTPKGSPGQNDLLMVHGNPGVEIRAFRVYNRWGELVFEQSDFEVNDPSRGWDGTKNGKPVPAGVYLWVLEAEFPDGKSEQSQGQTTLIR